MCVLANILHEISGKVLLDMFYEREKTLTHDACVFSLRRKRETIVRTMPARSIRRYLRSSETVDGSVVKDWLIRDSDGNWTVDESKAADYVQQLAYKYDM